MLYRGLDHPNEKLVELLLVAGEARRLGAKRLILVTPYLAYMRQDIAFNPGEVVSQRVIGQLLAGQFDALITVDPHLHRVATLQEAVPLADAVTLCAAPALARLIAERHPDALLIGPDAEALQWIEAAAAEHGFEHGVCNKLRHGDHQWRSPCRTCGSPGAMWCCSMTSPAPGAPLPRPRRNCRRRRLGGRGRDPRAVRRRRAAGDPRRRCRARLEHRLHRPREQRRKHGAAAGRGAQAATALTGRVENA